MKSISRRLLRAIARNNNGHKYRSVSIEDQDNEQRKNRVTNGVYTAQINLNLAKGESRQSCSQHNIKVRTIPCPWE